MGSLLRYRTVIYAGTVLTGLTGLVYQVVWQKYLTFVVGSDARSVSLVIAVFLAGLAAGYRFWGRLSERSPGRRHLLRVYGAIEIGIGIYAAAFPYWLKVVQAIAYRGPSGLVTDLAVTALALGIPTFLMGATIPLLVSIVPENADEVHLCHARIYGLNTLGACIGAFGASLFLIPRIGLPGSLLLGAATNLLVGAIFLLNRLSRSEIVRDDTIHSVPNRFGPWAPYAFTLITGTLTLSLEVLFVRVLSLTIGPGPHNFAIVVGVFILGLAIGSLIVTHRRLTVDFLLGSIAVLAVYLMIVFHSVPYWPYWMNNVRALLVALPVNYGVYMLIVTGFLGIVLLPFLIPLGSMLPLVYALIPKDTHDYGKKCGWMYFYNTVGTALGAIVLSYLLLKFVDLDQVFKIGVLLLVALALYLFWREGRRIPAVILAILCVAFLAGPRWDRSSHYVGLFPMQSVEPFNFQGVFRKPRIVEQIEFFEDGPDSTVTVARWARPGLPSRPGEGQPTSLSLVINGNTDGDTVLDFTTIHLAALLPYLHGPDRTELDTAVVGMGTGITAGLLALGEDVRETTVVEISSTLVRSAPEFEEANYGLTTNPKVRIVDTDGFKYFTRLDGSLDIVVSATSLPWVVGVENVFTPEFYGLVHDRLRDDGVFLQWFPLFDMDPILFRTIVKNLGSVFPHLRLYRISGSELGLMASKAPFREPLARRFQEPTILKARLRMQLSNIDLLELIRAFDDPQLRFLVQQRDAELPAHTLTHPSLAYRSDLLRFLNQEIDWSRYIDPPLSRLTRNDAALSEAFENLAARYPSGIPCPGAYDGIRLFCERLNPLVGAYSAFQGPPGTNVARRLEAYDVLRSTGVVGRSAEFLGQMTSELIDGLVDPGGDRPTLVRAVIEQYDKDGLWPEALGDLERFGGGGWIAQGQARQFAGILQNDRQAYERFVESYRSVAPGFSP